MPLCAKISVIDFIPIDTIFRFNHVAGFQIIDVRADTMAIGLTQKNNHKPHFLVCRNGFNSSANKILNNYLLFKNHDSSEIVILVKKFWITTGLDDTDNGHYWNLTLDTSKDIHVSIIASFEFYLKKDNMFTALYKYDSVFNRKTTVSKDPVDFIGDVFLKEKTQSASTNEHNLISEVFLSSIRRLVKLDAELNSNILKKRKFSEQDLVNHYTKWYDFPILTDSIYNAGVYSGFEEFKNNSPTEKNFTVTKDKVNDVLYVRKPNGSEEMAGKVWGYCDGENLFIRSGQNFFPLQKRGNSFYIYGSKKTVRMIHQQSGGSPSVSGGGVNIASIPMQGKSEKFKLELRPYQLDWDTGELN